VVTDLIQIKRLGEKKQVENERFRRYLKRHNFPELRFRRIAEDIENQTDCRACANCCKVAETWESPRGISSNNTPLHPRSKKTKSFCAAANRAASSSRATTVLFTTRVPLPAAISPT
jgi:hypothetical protein